MKYNWNKENLEKYVREANCWFNWLELLKIPKAGYNYRTLKNKAKLYEINTAHFNYNYAKTHNGKHCINLTNSELFSNLGGHNKNVIKREYIQRILNGNYYCENCKITKWNNKYITLQIHHIDGDAKNNEINNLQLLCPNCHSQTSNFGNRKN